MIEILKKQWFVILIALIFVSFAIFYAYDTNKDKLPGKSVDSQDLVASVSGKNISAEDVYKDLKNSMGGSVMYLYFERAVVDQSVDTTSKLKEEAQTKAKAYRQQVEAQYGTDTDEFLRKGLNSIGYGADELEDYFLHYLKVDKLTNSYIEKHLKKLFEPIYKEKNPRVVSHILIKMEDPKNPTEKELKKVKKVEDALAKGEDFAKVAKKYSDDAGSKAAGGNLGYADTDTSFVQAFKDKAFAMKEGEVSDWVQVSSTDYNGWHKIKIDETDMNTIMKDKNAKEGLYKAIQTANPEMRSTIIWEQAKKLKIDFKDKELKKALMDYMGIKE